MVNVNTDYKLFYGLLGFFIGGTVVGIFAMFLFTIAEFPDPDEMKELEYTACDFGCIEQLRQDDFKKCDVSCYEMYIIDKYSD